jgi:plasmid stability protein
MAQIIVRQLEDEVKARLQRQADRHGRSMEAEVRDILRAAAKNDGRPAGGLGSRIADRFRAHGLDSDLPEIRGQSPNSAEFHD